MYILREVLDEIYVCEYYGNIIIYVLFWFQTDKHSRTERENLIWDNQGNWFSYEFTSFISRFKPWQTKLTCKKHTQMENIENSLERLVVCHCFPA